MAPLLVRSRKNSDDPMYNVFCKRGHKVRHSGVPNCFMPQRNPINISALGIVSIWSGDHST